ncbi:MULTISPECIES: phenylacetic acid degradation protein PaaY [unclassified Sphingobium]|uniref:phenylacetic acid degradation protein PaaY n=1 Tax=unclassified Sphingobium TaxID=2611147 RepID=UPI0035A6F600
MPTYAFEGLRPVVAPDAYVHPSAVLIGDVKIAEGCYVGPNASLRGDFGRIEIGPGANIQDNCTVHSFPGRVVSVEANGHVGHGAILHGCTVGDNALIGMNAVVMDNAIVGPDCIVAAHSFIKAGTKCQPGTLWAGSPAREVRAVTDDEKAWKLRGTLEYQALAARSLKSLVLCEPLTAAEPDRPRLSGDFQPLGEWRARSPTTNDQEEAESKDG